MVNGRMLIADAVSATASDELHADRGEPPLEVLTPQNLHQLSQVSGVKTVPRVSGALSSL